MKTLHLLGFVVAVVIGNLSSTAHATALQFDGSNDYVTAAVPAPFSNFPNADFTFTGRIRPDASANGRVMFVQIDTTHFVSILISNTRALYFYVTVGGTTHSLASQPLTSGQWSSFAARWDAGTQTVSLIVEGVAATVSGGGSTFGNDNLFTLGARTDGLQPINATLDDLALWPTALTDQQVAVVASEFCLEGVIPDLLYDFEVGTPGADNTGLTTLPDTTGNGLDGLLNNFALTGNTSNWVDSPFTGCSGADQAISLSATPDPVTAGNNVTWNAELVATGNNDASNSLVQGEVPAGTTFVSLAAPAGFSCSTPAAGATGTLTCTAAAVPNGTGSFVLVTATDSNVTPNSTLSATWTAHADNDFITGNDSASATTTVANALLLQDDEASTPFEQAIVIDVLLNDGTAAGGAPLDPGTLSLFSAPVNGSANCTTSGCTYTPAAAFTGVDQFDYEVCDTSAAPVCDTALVRIAVAPKANDDSFTMGQNGILTATVAGNDIYPTGGNYTVSSLPTSGSLSLSGDGSFTYTPNTGYYGSDSFGYALCLPSPDDAICDSALVSLDIQASALSLSPGSGALPLGLAGQAYGPVTIAASGGTAPYQFSVSGALPPGLTLDQATGAISGTPTSLGDYAFDITVTDSSVGSGPLQATGSFTISIAAGAAMVVAVPSLGGLGELAMLLGCIALAMFALKRRNPADCA
ncbi:Ig-like domain-containing protein [Dokdonella immobilis]|uniref:Putative Ig domain-containing protein n=1 Tax=Dokdonella immobilis TaxID=578942 RepID=A0A1I4Y682_9GAMM|nr:Ig-like domain-containing protein [Dokdonella immobilis]SFN33582.1 Putative Ig domain-containing protein [Dokdonella immobilis]